MKRQKLAVTDNRLQNDDMANKSYSTGKIKTINYNY